MVSSRKQAAYKLSGIEDNTMVVFCINKEGGMKSGSLCAIPIMVQSEEHCSTNPVHPGSVKCHCR